MNSLDRLIDSLESFGTALLAVLVAIGAYVLVLLFLGGCATNEKPDAIPHSPWHLSTVRPPAKYPPLILEVNRIPFCGLHAEGCYVPEDLKNAIPGRIYIAQRLEPWEYWCVRQHEMRHHQGWDHPDGFSDCG